MRFRNRKKSDADLLTLYRQKGDMEALGILYDRYLELIFGVCLKYFKNPERAEDAVMEIFEELVKKARKHEVKEFRPWLYVLAKNYCLMQLRKKEILQPIEPGLMQSEDFLHPIIENGQEEREETFQSLEKCIEKLAPQQKECIDLFYLKGQSYKEIASNLPLEIGKVRSHIQNGRRNLKNCMENAKVSSSRL